MAGERWLFTKAQLSTTPSRKNGLDSDKELSYRQQAANLIQDMGQRLQVNQLTINTAIVYMHRFYVFQSFTRFHRNSLAPACLFLAAKVEEQPRKLEHVIKVAYLCLNRETPHLDPKSEKYLELAQELVINENVLLQTLGFEVTVDHPHIHVVNTCELVRAPRDLAQTCYFLATNSLHLTTLCLQQRPAIVALVCIHLACKWSGWKIPKSAENKDWFSYVDKEITLDKLEGLAQDFLQILDKCPNRLKRKIMGGKSGPGPGPREAGSSDDKHARLLEASDSKPSTSVKDLLASDMQSTITDLSPPQTEHPELSEKSMFDSPTTVKPKTPSQTPTALSATATAGDTAGGKLKRDKIHGLSYEEYVKRKGRDSLADKNVQISEKDRKLYEVKSGNLPRHSMSCSDLSKLDPSAGYKPERLNIFTKLDSNLKTKETDLDNKLKLEIDASLKALQSNTRTDGKNRDHHAIPDTSRGSQNVPSSHSSTKVKTEVQSPPGSSKVKPDGSTRSSKERVDVHSPQLSSKVKHELISPQTMPKVKQELMSSQPISKVKQDFTSPPSSSKIKSELTSPPGNMRIKEDFTTPPNSSRSKLKLEMPSPQITSKVSPDVPSPHIRVKIPPLDPSYEIKLSTSRPSVTNKEDLVAQSAHAAKTKHSAHPASDSATDVAKYAPPDVSKHAIPDVSRHATSDVVKHRIGHHHSDKKSHSHSDSGLKLKIKTGDGDKHYRVKSEHRHKGEHKSPKLHIKIGRPSPSSASESAASAVKAETAQASSPLKLKIKGLSKIDAGKSDENHEKSSKRDKHASASQSAVDANPGHKGELKLRISTSQLGGHVTKHPNQHSDEGRSGHRESSRKSHSKERHSDSHSGVNSVDSGGSHHRKRPHSPERDAQRMRPTDNKHARTGNRSRKSSNTSSQGVIDMDVCTTPTDLVSPDIATRDVEANGSHTNSPHPLSRTESTENLTQLKMKLEQIIEMQKTNFALQKASPPILPNVPPPPPPPLPQEQGYGYDSVKRVKGQSTYQPPLPPSVSPPPPPPPPPR